MISNWCRRLSSTLYVSKESECWLPLTCNGTDRRQIPTTTYTLHRPRDCSWKRGEKRGCKTSLSLSPRPHKRAGSSFSPSSSILRSSLTVERVLLSGQWQRPIGDPAMASAPIPRTRLRPRGGRHIFLAEGEGGTGSVHV